MEEEEKIFFKEILCILDKIFFCHGWKLNIYIQDEKERRSERKKKFTDTDAKDFFIHK